MDQLMIVNGEAVAAEATSPVDNPATGEVIAQVPAPAASFVDDVVAVARSAFEGWSRDAAARRDAVARCGDRLHEVGEDIARWLTLEQGKPLARARAEVELAANWFTWTSELPTDSARLRDEPTETIDLHRRPYGVVAAITPWNYPIILAVAKIAPALLAGNTVVLKPSPATPVATLRMGAALADVLPPGVLNVLTGDVQLGHALVSHAGVAKVSLTGSVATGKAVAAAAAQDLKRVTLELGGNDAAVVLPGADLDEVAEPLFWIAFENSGQFCAAIKRIYVPDTLADDLVDRMGELARSAVVGDGMAPDTQLGPLTTPAQRDFVRTLVEEARSAGARVVAGGHDLDGAGNFYAPTIVGEVPPGTRLEQEEQFGPALPVIAYSELDEAVERANRTRYGLGGSVWGPEAAAVEVADRLRAGTVWVNTHADLRNDAPFGGIGWSGLGSEYGIWGLHEFSYMKVLNVHRRP